MSKSYRWLWVCGALLLVLAAAGCMSRQTPVPSPTSGPPVKVASWTQTTVSDFEAGQLEQVWVGDAGGGELRLPDGAAQGVYTSTVVTANFPFNAIVAHWKADSLPGSDVQVELRFDTGAQGWSSWQAIADAEWSPEKEQFYPETPILVLKGVRFQYRVTLSTLAGVEAPVLYEMTLTYFDSSAGPTTMQAKMFTQMEIATEQGVSGPSIITRAGWGANESYRTWTPEYRTVHKIVVHHTVTSNDYDEMQGAAWVRAIYYYHAVTRGWGDIGYNYLVDKYGNIYQGRYGGPGVVGGHVYSFNYGTMGVAVIGTYGNYRGSIEPTPASLSALADLSVWEASRSYIHPLHSALFRNEMLPNLGGHRDYPPFTTSCPGDLLYAALPALRQSVWERLSAHVPRYGVEWLDWDRLPESPLQAGETYYINVRVRNTGWFDWPSEGKNAVRLGYHWLDANGQPVVQPPEDDRRTPLAQAISFGDIYGWEAAPVTTPRTPGTFTLVWDLVHEGVTWFDDAGGQTLEMTVVVGVAATATPASDFGVIQNGGFEDDGGWTIYETAYPARYVDRPQRSGGRALQTGIETGAGNIFSYSSAEQTFVVPAAGDATLSYWYQARVDNGDYAYIYLRPEGANWQVLKSIKRDVPDWSQATHDLGAYAGRRVTLRFGTYNNGRGGASMMVVDDVRLGASAPTATPAPAATSTPTSTPTPAPPTATATPLPTATPTASACSELAVNGDFETDDGWSVANTPHKARFTDALVYTGARSLQLGIADRTQNRFTYSSVEQQFSVPAGRKATLVFWYNMVDSGGGGDYGYFVIRPQGGSWRVLRIVSAPTAGWTRFEVDVSHYAGKSFSLRLGTRNDGGGDGAATVMYIDALSLLACRR